MEKAAVKKRHRLTKIEKRDALVGYAFIAPYLVLFTIFTGVPLISAFLLSFVNVRFITTISNLRFVGLDNFIRVFKSPEIMGSLGRTILYSAIYVPVIMVLGFVFALLLNKGVYMAKALRSMVFLPYISNMMAVAIVFQILLGPRGPIMPLLRMVGLTRPPLLDTNFALPTIVLIAVWKGVGLNMLVYLGALQGVSQELIEASSIDGCTRFQQIKNIIIPSISPSTFFLVISSIITSLQNYTVVQSLTEGGPGQATTVMSVSIVRTAFVQFDTSFASAQALVVFAIVMAVTVVQWYGQKKWVNY